MKLEGLRPNGLLPLYLIRPVLLAAPTGSGLPGSIALCVAGLRFGRRLDHIEKRFNHYRLIVACMLSVKIALFVDQCIAAGVCNFFQRT